MRALALFGVFLAFLCSNHNPVRAGHVILTEADMARVLAPLIAGKTEAVLVLTKTGASWRKGTLPFSAPQGHIALALAVFDAAEQGRIKLSDPLPSGLVPRREGYPVTWAFLLSGTTGIQEAADGGGTLIRAYPPGRVADPFSADMLLLQRAAKAARLAPASATAPSVLLSRLLAEPGAGTVVWRPHPLASGHSFGLREADISGRQALLAADGRDAIILFPDHGVALALHQNGWRKTAAAFADVLLPPEKNWPRAALTAEERERLTAMTARQRLDGQFIPKDRLFPDSPSRRFALWPDRARPLNILKNGDARFLGRFWRRIAPLAWTSGPDRLFASSGGGMTVLTLQRPGASAEVWLRGNVAAGSFGGRRAFFAALILAASLGLHALRRGAPPALRRAGILALGGAALFICGFWGEASLGVNIPLRIIQNGGLLLLLASIVAIFKFSRETGGNRPSPIRLHAFLAAIAASYLILLAFSLGIAGELTPTGVYF